MSNQEAIAAARAVRDFTNWTAYLAEAAQWVTDHGRMPSKRSDDLRESRFADWITSQRQQKKAGAFTPEKIAAIGQAIPDWDIVRTKDDMWSPPAGRAGAFYAQYGRVPHPDAADEQERTIGRWLSKQRKNAQSMDQAKSEQLDSTVPGWRHLPRDVTRRKRTAVRTAPQFDYARKGFDRWPFHIFDFLETPPRRPTVIPATLLNIKGFCGKDLAENAFGEYLEHLIRSVYDVFPQKRPTYDGAFALFTWVEWAELEMDLALLGDDSFDEFHSGLLTGAVTLMGSKFETSAGIDELASGAAEASFDEYTRANDAAINRGVSQFDLDRWADGLRGRDETPFLRGQAVAGVALAQLDAWWGFRFGPTPAATGIPYNG